MTILDNYLLIEEKYIEDEQASAYLYEHKNTKARVFILKNDDINRLFSIGFRTPPKGSTGVCHILEHCVLNGSKKYRTREPFMDMIKSSLQTFLNAMTYSDKTLYPVASRNTRDFENLMDVYLDAVFNPKVREEEKIFMQEGWRYDLSDDGELTYKGVVYNEMKGAMSSAEDQVFDSIYKNLMPDTIYSLNSGGDPYDIPNLTYDDFIAYYEEFYHPSNSYIFLYGDVDTDKYLDYIHDEYLSEYDYRQINSELKSQPKFDKPRHLVDYFSSDKTDNDKSNMVSYSIVTGDSTNDYDRIMNLLIYQIIINSESSPLKKAINDLDIVEDIINASSSAKQMVFSILGKNIKEENVQLFIDTVDSTLEELVEKGIDPDLTRSMLNVMSFSLKEKNDNATKGIAYLSRIFSTWLYDQSPIKGLEISNILKDIESKLDQGVVEKFIKDNMVENSHKLTVTHKPKKGLNAEKDMVIKNHLSDLAASLSEDKKDRLIKQRNDMEYFQNKEDSPEDKATIPTLELSDINSKFDPVDRTVEEKDGVTYLTHDLATSGIDYLNFVFDINHIEKEDIQYVSLLSDLLGMIDTKNYNYQDLFTKIYLETGGLSYTVSSYNHLDTKKFNRILTLTSKNFSNNIDNALDILKEVSLNTVFDNKKRVKEILTMIYSRLEMGLLDYAHQTLVNRVNKSNSKANDFSDRVNGIDAYLFYKNLLDEDIDLVIDKLKDVYGKVFTRKNLVVNITSDFTERERLTSKIEEFVSSFDTTDAEDVEYEIDSKRTKEAIIASTDVSYVSIGNNLEEFGYEFKADATVISNIVSNAYLYNEIRAKGGAYGAGMMVNNKNLFATYSYRDPNIKKTLDTYYGIPNFMDSLNLSDEDLKAFIIGAVGRFDPPQTEKSRGASDLNMYLTGKSYEDLEKNVKEALAINKKSIQDLSEILSKAISEANISILTNKELAESNKDLFDTIIDLT